MESRFPKNMCRLPLPLRFWTGAEADDQGAPEIAPLSRNRLLATVLYCTVLYCTVYTRRACAAWTNEASIAHSRMQLSAALCRQPTGAGHLY